MPRCNSSGKRRKNIRTKVGCLHFVPDRFFFSLNNCTGRSFQPVQAAELEKGAYMQQFDQLWRFVQEVEKKLIMYHAVFGDDQSPTKPVAIVGADLI